MEGARALWRQGIVVSPVVACMVLVLTIEVDRLSVMTAQLLTPLIGGSIVVPMRKSSYP